MIGQESTPWLEQRGEVGLKRGKKRKDVIRERGDTFWHRERGRGSAKISAGGHMGFWKTLGEKHLPKRGGGGEEDKSPGE